MQERYGYNAFGQLRVMTPTFGNRSSSSYTWETFFGAYRWDSETGFYQVRYRYLHPTLGRWITRDPIDYSGGINLYAYVENKTTNQVDWQGLAGGLCPNPNWPPLQVPPGGSKPTTPGKLGALGVALALILAAFAVAIDKCKCNKTAPACQSCCNGLTYGAIAADLAAAALADAACFGYVLPWVIAACVIATGVTQALADKAVLSAQNSCLEECNKLPPQ